MKVDNKVYCDYCGRWIQEPSVNYYLYGGSDAMKQPHELIRVDLCSKCMEKLPKHRESLQKHRIQSSVR